MLLTGLWTAIDHAADCFKGPAGMDLLYTWDFGLP